MANTATTKPPTREELQRQLNEALASVSRLQAQGLPDNSPSLIEEYTTIGRLTRQIDALKPATLTHESARAELAQLNKDLVTIKANQEKREKEVGIVRAASEFDTERMQISRRVNYLNSFLRSGTIPAPKQRALTTAERAEVNRLQGQITALQERLEGVTEQPQQIRLVSQINVAKGRLLQLGVSV